MRLYGLYLVAIFALLVGHHTHAQNQFHKVFLQCSIAQGNGFNWASTVGWLAGNIEELTERAARYERDHNGKRAGIDISCFTGSSSSGFTAGLLDHLLNNKNLVPRSGVARKILSISQASRVAKALHFLARSMDFSLNEKISTGISVLEARAGLVDINTQALPGKVWSGTVSVGAIKKRFDKWITAADYFEMSWLANSKNAKSFVNQQVAKRSLKALPMADDFCVTGLVVPLGQMIAPLNYDDLKLMYVCNPQTVQKVMTRELFSLLHSGLEMKNRFIIASTNDWSIAQNITVREPELNAVLSGSLIRSPIGLSKAYELRDNGFYGLSSKAHHLVVGGFADARMQSWVGTAILMKRQHELESQGIEVESRVVIFGKIEDRTDSTSSFAQKSIVKFFTNYPINGDWSSAAHTLNLYYRWQDDYCRVIGRIKNIEFEFYRMDWNLSDRPAALTGQSGVLSEMGYALGKSTPLNCKL